MNNDKESEYISSILTSVKKELGIAEDYTHFDADVLTHINSTLSIFFQLGIGPQDKAVQVVDDSTTWEEFLENKEELNMARVQMFVRVKMLFDPPSTTHVSQAMQSTLTELDWRSVVAAEEGRNEE